MTGQRYVVVVGAGAFGGWTALSLRRRGARVTLIDAWGPGNARASSGGETRAIRGIYGRDRIYTEWVARALEIWRDSDVRWGTELYRRTGALWMCGEDDRYVRAALPHLAAFGLVCEQIAVEEASRRFADVDFGGVAHVYLEEEAGTLFARMACETVARVFSGEGGEYLPLAARPTEIVNSTLGSIELSDGARLEADVYVFACGPWMPTLFPDVLGAGLRVSRQETYYFGTPSGSSFGALPIWIDLELGYYGLPASQWRGFKVADDRRGPDFDPTHGDRVPTPEGIEAARAFVGRRFPALAKGPLLEARVCQYTSSADGHLIVDRHPDASNVWLVGGGSGHGFKLGPAIGEVVTAHVLDDEPVNPQLAIERLARLGAPGGTIFEPVDRGEP